MNSEFTIYQIHSGNWTSQVRRYLKSQLFLKYFFHSSLPMGSFIYADDRFCGTSFLPTNRISFLKCHSDLLYQQSSLIEDYRSHDNFRQSYTSQKFRSCAPCYYPNLWTLSFAIADQRFVLDVQIRHTQVSGRFAEISTLVDHNFMYTDNRLGSSTDMKRTSNILFCRLQKISPQIHKILVSTSLTL